MKSFCIKLFLSFLVGLFSYSSIGQCNQNYDWIQWNSFTGTSASGTVPYNGHQVNVSMNANYSFTSTGYIFNYSAFSAFLNPPPNNTVPATTWAVGAGGQTTMCFSETVQNPVLLLSSIGASSLIVTLHFSRPYSLVYDGGGVNYLNDSTIVGAEGYAIIKFPGNFDCITIYSSTPENWTNITWGLNPPLFPVNILEVSNSCGFASYTASGASTYLWSGGLTPNQASNTFTSNGTYFLTATDQNGCEVNTSQSVVINNAFPVIFNQDTIRACGNSYTLDAGVGYNSYSWNTGASTSSINVSATGWYACTVNQASCTATDSVFVSLINAQITNNDTTVCAGTNLQLSAVGSSNNLTICNMNITKTSIPLGNPIPGFTYGGFYNGHYYYVYNTPTTWTAGELVCRQSGGYLVCINDINENNFVINLTNNNIWIGLFRDPATCNFRWLDCQNITFTNWRPGEPNSGPCGEPYAQIIRGCSYGLNTWNNLDDFSNNGACYSNDVPIMEIDPTIYPNYGPYPLSYQWSNGATIPTISVSPSQTTTYYCTISNGISSCIDSVKVTLNNQNFILQDTIRVCGDSYTLDAGAGYASYNWNTGATIQTINVNTTGWYNCIVSQGNCVFKDSVFISIVNAHIINNDTTICAGNSLTLSSAPTNSPIPSNIILPTGANYEYQLSSPPSNWTTTTGGWNTSNAPFGNSLGGPFGYNTYWPVWNSLFVRKEINLTSYDLNSINWFLGVDNGYTLYVNGNLISSDFQQGYTFQWEYSGQIPIQFLNQGINIIAVALTDQGGATAFDMQITGNPIIFPSTLVWSTGESTPIINVTPSQTTTYYCTVSNSITSCIDSVKITLTQPDTSLNIITSCDNFLWNGNTYSSSGNYFYNTNNNIGCDSVAKLQLTIKASSHNIINLTTCDSLRWHNILHTTSGTYLYNYTNSIGCPSTDTLNLNVNYSTHNSIIQISCDSLRWNNTLYNTSGTYLYSYLNSFGCSSTDTLHLTINISTHNAVFQTTCDSLRWHGILYTTSGTYLYNYANPLGCQSTDTLHLVVLYATHNIENQTTCDSLRWHNILHTTSGNYLYNYTNSIGCPSTDTLHLNVNYSTHNIIIQTSCDSLRWNNTLYNTSGTYLYSYLNSFGCSSTDTLHLTINISTHNAVFQTTCDSLRWHGTLYTTSGTYLYNYANPLGCQSTDTLHLTIKNSTHNSETYSACRYYIWHNNTYSLSGTYLYNYTNSNGCPSTDTMHLIIFPGPSLGVDKIIEICFGKEKDLTTIFNTTNLNSSWSSNGTTLTDPIHVGNAGIYEIIVTDQNNCRDTGKVNLIIQPEIIANAGNDTIVQSNVYFQLHGTGGITYIWDPSNFLINPYVPNPSANISLTTTFVLTALDNIGCFDTDTIIVKALKGPEVYVPNAFTPNDDGTNDLFRPILVGLTSLNYFRIYNRYGELLFETTNINKGWDGTFKGKKQAMANYIWTLSAKDTSGKMKEIKGNILLLR